MSGLRGRQKEQRRQAILEAALELLRSNDIGSVTIEQIAARAQVSPPTIYNLVGTREQLLVALIDRVIEGLLDLGDPEMGDAEDPIGMARRAVDRSTAAFVADSDAYRQIVRSLGDLAVSGSRVAFDPTQMHILLMRRAQELGILRADLDPVALGRQSFLSYVAAMNLWAAGTLDDEGFGVAARHGLATVLSAASTEAHRVAIVGELEELGRRFARVSWDPR